MTAIGFPSKLYIIGGGRVPEQDGEGRRASRFVHFGDVWCVDMGELACREIQAGGDAFEARRGHTAVAYRDRYIVVFGGVGDAAPEAGAGAGLLGDVVVFDTEAERWMRPDIAEAGTDGADAPPVARRGHCASVHGRYMLVHGGECVTPPATDEEFGLVQLHERSVLHVLDLGGLESGAPLRWRRLLLEANFGSPDLSAALRNARGVRRANDAVVAMLRGFPWEYVLLEMGLPSTFSMCSALVLNGNLLVTGGCGVLEAVDGRCLPSYVLDLSSVERRFASDAAGAAADNFAWRLPLRPPAVPGGPSVDDMPTPCGRSFHAVSALPTSAPGTCYEGRALLFGGMTGGGTTSGGGGGGERNLNDVWLLRMDGTRMAWKRLGPVDGAAPEPSARNATTLTPFWTRYGCGLFAFGGGRFPEDYRADMWMLQLSGSCRPGPPGRHLGVPRSAPLAQLCEQVIAGPGVLHRETVLELYAFAGRAGAKLVAVACINFVRVVRTIAGDRAEEQLPGWDALGPALQEKLRARPAPAHLARPHLP